MREAYAVPLSRTLVIVVIPDSGDTPRDVYEGPGARRCQPVMAAFRTGVVPSGSSNLAVA